MKLTKRFRFVQLGRLWLDMKPARLLRTDWVKKRIADQGSLPQDAEKSRNEKTYLSPLHPTLDHRRRTEGLARYLKVSICSSVWKESKLTLLFWRSVDCPPFKRHIQNRPLGICKTRDRRQSWATGTGRRARSLTSEADSRIPSSPKRGAVHYGHNFIPESLGC